MTRVRAASGDGAGEAERDAAAVAEKEGLIDRDNLDASYYKGFIESDIGEEDNASGRDKLGASMKLAAGTRQLGGRGGHLSRAITATLPLPDC